MPQEMVVLIAYMLVVFLFWLPVFWGGIYSFIKNKKLNIRFGILCGFFTHGIYTLSAPIIITPYIIVNVVFLNDYCDNDMASRLCVFNEALYDWGFYVIVALMIIICLLSPKMVNRFFKGADIP